MFVHALSSTISGNFGVDVTTLALVEVDLLFEDVNFSSVTLEFVFVALFQLVSQLLLLVVVVEEDVLLVGVEALVEISLGLAKLSDHVQKVGVLLDFLSQLALSLGEGSGVVFDRSVALLLLFVVLVGKFDNGGRRTRNFKRV